METKKNFKSEKSSNLLNVVTYKELQEKPVCLKTEAQAFEAGDFLNTFLRFQGFCGPFSYKKFSYIKKTHIAPLQKSKNVLRKGLQKGQEKACEFAKLRALRAFLLCVPSCHTCLRALRAFAYYVPYSRALSTRLASLFQVLCTSYLCTLKSFQDRFVVQQKLPIFQGLSKTLQTVPCLCGKKNSRETC